MKQGEFLSTDDPLEIEIISPSTGSFTLEAHIPGTGVRTGSFTAVTGVAFSLPNIFPEKGSFNFYIKDPGGAYIGDGSSCPMYLEVNLACGP